ncbi:MAG: MarR family winged helix-turn-helix transcriptional regulator, partial [Gemmatimonadota bacterium]
MNDLAARTPTTPADADAGTMFSLIAAAHTVEARLEEALAEVGLSMAKHGVLRILVEAGEPMPLGELAKLQSCVRSNMTQLVDRLEADGLVRRVADPEDRRMVRAALTAAGEAREAEGAERIARVRDDFAASLPEADR